MEMALGERNGTIFSAGVRTGAGATAGREFATAPVSAYCGSEASVSVSGRAIRFAFISTPEMLRRASAKAPQEFTRSGPNSQGKEWIAKMPLERAGVNLWKSGEVSYLQTHSFSTGVVDAGCEKGTDCRQYGSSNGLAMLLLSEFSA